MSTTHRVCVLLLCGLTVISNTGLAQRWTVKRGPTPIPTHPETVISAVNASSITVAVQVVRDADGEVLKKTSSKILLVTPFTEISVNGQRATVAQLRPGMKVSVTMSTDPTKAARIIANG